MEYTSNIQENVSTINLKNKNVIVDGEVTASKFIGDGSSISNVKLDSVSANSIAWGQSYIDNYRNRLLDNGYTYFPNQSAYKFAKLKEMNLHNKASIVVSPSGVKASLLPAIKGLPLDFTRNSTATYIDEDGVMQTALANVPRVTYDENGDESILMESQSTNLALYSNDFNNASWTKTAMTVSTNTHLSPSNELAADTVFETATLANHAVVGGSISYVAGTTYTGSVFFKPNGRNIRLTCSNTSFTNTFNAIFDTTTKALINTSVGGNGVVSDNSIEDYGNGWYRISVSGNLPTDTFIRFTVYSIDGTTSNFLGDVTKGLVIWGAQLEALPYATSYIPTEASTVTRVIETYSKTGLQNYINSTQGTFFIKCKSLTNKTGVDTFNISLNDGFTNNRVVIAYTSNSEIYILFTVSGVLVYDAFLNTDLTQIHSIAISWSENNFLTYINGNLIEEQLTGITFPVNTLNRISSSSGGVPWRSIPYIYNLQVFNQALTDQELINLTTL